MYVHVAYMYNLNLALGCRLFQKSLADLGSQVMVIKITTAASMIKIRSLMKRMTETSNEETLYNYHTKT